MSKIERYPLDLLVSAQDKLVGTDAAGRPTKNYRVSDLMAFFKNSIGVFDGVLISALDSRFGVPNDGVSDDWAGLQACADYCSQNGYTMFVPYTGTDYLISRPIVPNRHSGLQIVLDAVIWAVDPAYDKVNLNGCVFAAGCLTHPYQKFIELLDGGAYLHRLASLNAGQRSVSVDLSLYNSLSAGEVVLLRSDLLAVDRTGDAPATVPSGERFGVYDFSVLNKVVSKNISSSGEFVIEFEHAIEEDVYEPRLLRFPEDQFIDNFREDPNYYIGPCQDFHLRCTSRGGVKTSGNQSFIQATCLYNFSIIDVNIIDSAGGVLCNALNYGDVAGLRGNCRGSYLEIAFSSNHVRCYNNFPTVRGRGDRTNPQCRITGVSFPLRNKGYGAINTEGVIDYSFDAVWYATDNRQHAILYNKDDQEWNYFTSGSELWPEGVNPSVLTGAFTTGWGDDVYVPVGEEGGLTVTKALSENKSTVNIHEGARNIWVEDSEIVVSSDYDFIDQDINIVGSGITFSGVRIYSNKQLDLAPGDLVDGDSISIGNVINGGDVPFSVNDIKIVDVLSSGRPMNAAVSVNECPLFPSKDTTSIQLFGPAAISGAFSKLDYNYILSGDTIQTASIERARDSTEQPQDRYYAYYSSARNALFVFSPSGVGGMGRGWYMIPAASVVEPGVPGELLTGVVFGSILNLYDSSDSFSFSNFSLLQYAVYLGSECEFVIFGPCRLFENASSESLTFVPNVAHRTFSGILVEDIKAKRAVLRGLHVRGGRGNTYRSVAYDRHIPENALSQTIPDLRYVIDVETRNGYYVSSNLFDDIKSYDQTFTAQVETIRDQGFSNKITNYSDVRSRAWMELARRYFRTAATGTMRQSWDNTASLGVNWPLINGRFVEGVTRNIDVLSWSGISSFRPGYGFCASFIGISEGTPTLNIKGGNASSPITIHSISLPLSAGFEIEVRVVLMDSLDYNPVGSPPGAAVSPGSTNSWVSVSYSLKYGTSEVSRSDVVAMSTVGGARSIIFEVDCLAGQQVNLFSYIVEPKTNFNE